GEACFLLVDHPRCKTLQDQVKCNIDIAELSLVRSTLVPHTFGRCLLSGCGKQFSCLLDLLSIGLQFDGRQPNLLVIGILVECLAEYSSSIIDLACMLFFSSDLQPETFRLWAGLDSL